MPDGLSDRYKELLTGTYDCVDRIVLNAYFGMGHSPGGFRVWWRALTGSDETLDNNHLMRLAGRFSRRVRGYAKAHDIPVIYCGPGERKHDLAEHHLTKTPITQGLFLVLVGRAQAPVWDVGMNYHLDSKRPYVNHYSFHILDDDWGHITIKISGHPPFPAQVILNGHHYVARQARKAGIRFTKDGNCFTAIGNMAGFAKIAATLSEQRTVGRLNRVCERWIYSCLCFALDFEEQKRSRFRYHFSNYQLEYSRNLIFQVGGRMEEVFQALIDRSRSRLDLRTIKTILGDKGRPRCRPRNMRVAAWEVTVEKPTYNLTIFKLNCGKLALKIYTKGERVLRIEAIAHNVRELHRARLLHNFPIIVRRLQTMLANFMEALSCIDQCFVGDRALEELPLPSKVGKITVGGIDLNKPRLRCVAQALIALSASADGFTAATLAAHVNQLTAQAPTTYGSRQAAYDLKKLRGKQIVCRIGSTRRYQPIPSGLRAITALLVLRDKAIKPLLAAAQRLVPSRGGQNPRAIDHHYHDMLIAMQGVFRELGVAA
jgi:hypothetical protein